MTVQVLIATMHQTDHSLLEKMNIQTDAIVCNQCDRNEVEEFTFRGHRIKWLSFSERGVGLNRNTALMRADADIVLFADDDVVYEDGYEAKIITFYKTHPKADVVIFNFLMRRGEGAFYDRVTKEGRVGSKGVTKYGAYCISAKTTKLRFHNLFFHLQFGGGAVYSNGEDTLFLQDCVKQGLGIYATKTRLGVLDHGASTWFQGYHDRFFFDKGVLYYLTNRKTAYMLACYHCIKHMKRYHEYGVYRAIRQMWAGIRFAKKQ